MRSASLLLLVVVGALVVLHLGSTPTQATSMSRLSRARSTIQSLRTSAGALVEGEAELQKPEPKKPAPKKPEEKKPRSITKAPEAKKPEAKKPDTKTPEASKPSSDASKKAAAAASKNGGAMGITNASKKSSPTDANKKDEPTPPKPAAKPTGPQCTGVAGVCLNSKSNHCSNGWVHDVCPGANDILCCPDKKQPPTQKQKGVDVSDYITSGTFKCMKEEGIERVVVRAWESACQLDYNAPGTLKNARAAGYAVANLDIYVFPQTDRCVSGATQVANTIAHVGKDNFNVIWLDIEMSGSNWSGNMAANRAFIADMVNEGTKQLGASRVGIYSSIAGWDVAARGQPGFPTHPLWFANYDVDSSVTASWSPFAGWTKPAGKQWAGSCPGCGPSTICGASVDFDTFVL